MTIRSGTAASVRPSRGGDGRRRRADAGGGRQEENDEGRPQRQQDVAERRRRRRTPARRAGGAVLDLLLLGFERLTRGRHRRSDGVRCQNGADDKTLLCTLLVRLRIAVHVSR